MNLRIEPSFFRRDVLDIAPELLGKTLVRRFDNRQIQRFRITETEAYSGNGDLACHASKGKTARTEVMFREGGLVYVYLIYGMYWMLNIVTGKENDAAALLIRGVEGFTGPGRVGKAFQLDNSLYGENLFTSERIWIEHDESVAKFTSSPRVGIDYSGEPWVSKPWRFTIKT